MPPVMATLRLVEATLQSVAAPDKTADATEETVADDVQVTPDTSV